MTARTRAKTPRAYNPEPPCTMLRSFIAVVIVTWMPIAVLVHQYA